MTAKQYLEQLSVLDRMVQEKVDCICLERSNLVYPSCFNSGDRVQTSNVSDRLCDNISKIIMMEQEYDVLVDRYVDLKRDICVKLNMMAYHKHKEILRMRYMERKSIHMIALELKMTDRGCKKAHKRALEEFDKILEKCKIGIDSSPIINI